MRQLSPFGMGVALVLLVASLGCEPTPTGTSVTAKHAESPWFEDRTADSGIDFLHTSGERQRFW